MNPDMMTEDAAHGAVAAYIGKESTISSTQDILNSGAVPRLSGYMVRPGKVSDSIMGGKFTIFEKDTGKDCVYENPPLNTKDGVPLRIMVRTERISTHDINRGVIPFKDQILAENHNFMRRLLQSAIGTSQFDVPGLADNAVVIAAENLKTIPVENVLRGYMAKSSTSTSLYQAYVVRGERTFAGHKLPEGLVTNGPLPYVMDTPSTKSDEHDATIDMEYLVKNKLCTPEQYVQTRNAGIFAFGMVSQYLKERGIIAVDTKTEHGTNRKGEIVSQDEIWTMDSSRFWLANDYKEQLEKFQRGEIKEINPKSYSKEFARGFSEGDKGYTDEQRIQIAIRYIVGIQHLLSKPFNPDTRQRDERVISGLETVVRELVA